MFKEKKNYETSLGKPLYNEAVITQMTIFSFIHYEVIYLKATFVVL